MPLADTLKERMAVVREHPELFSRVLGEGWLAQPKKSRTAAGRDSEILKTRLVDGLTLSDTGLQHGVSRERVRQIEAKAWRKFERIVAEAADATR